MVEYENSQKTAVPLIVSLTISVITVIMILATFFLELLSSDNNPLMPGIVGGMSVIPIFGISFALYLLKSPVKIRIKEEDLSVEWLIGQKTFLWSVISRVELKKPGVYQNWAASFSKKKHVPPELMVVFDQNNKKIMEIGNNMDNFPTIMREIRERSGAVQGRTVFDAKECIQKNISAQKKGRIFMLVFGIFLAVLSITMLVTSLISNNNLRLLQTDGQVIDATISKHYLYNITPRLEYTFTIPDGQSFSKDVMVEKSYWESLTEGGNVPVRYLPIKPEQSELLYDDTDNSDLPVALVIPVSIITFIIGAVCVVMYFLKITDLKFEDGRFKVIRLGDVDSEILVHETDEDFKEKHDAPIAIPFKPAMANIHETSQLNRVPKGLKAIGVLNVVFGALGVLWNGGRVFLALIIINNPNMLMGNMALSEETSAIFAEHIFSVIIALLLSISGIGILLLKNWGRILALIVVTGQLLLGLKDIVTILLSIVSGSEGVAPEQRFVINITIAFFIVFVILTMVYPAIVFILLRRKTTCEVFRKQLSEI